MLRLLASIAAALVSTIAFAADLAPASAPGISWSGVYAGINGVGVAGDADVSIPLYPANFDLDTNGLVADPIGPVSACHSEVEPVDVVLCADSPGLDDQLLVGEAVRRMLDSLPPYSAGKPPLFSLMFLTASVLKVVANPPRWNGL